MKLGAVARLSDTLSSSTLSTSASPCEEPPHELQQPSLRFAESEAASSFAVAWPFERCLGPKSRPLGQVSPPGSPSWRPDHVPADCVIRLRKRLGAVEAFDASPGRGRSTSRSQRWREWPRTTHGWHIFEKSWTPKGQNQSSLPGCRCHMPCDCCATLEPRHCPGTAR